MFQNRTFHRLAAVALLMMAFAVPAVAAPGDLDSADVAEMTMPAVVNINTDKVVERQSHPFMDDPFFRRFFENQRPDGDNERLERSLAHRIGRVARPEDRGHRARDHHDGIARWRQHLRRFGHHDRGGVFQLSHLGELLEHTTNLDSHLHSDHRWYPDHPTAYCHRYHIFR